MLKIKSIPTLNPGLKLASILKNILPSTLPGEESPVIETKFKDGTIERYYPKSDKIIAMYTDGRKITSTPGELIKVEHPKKVLEDGKPQRSTVYKEVKEHMNERIKKIFFIANDFLNGHLSIVDEIKNKVTHFYKNGAIKVYKDKKPKKTDFLDANISRRALPDGTQIKVFKEKGIRTVKHLGPQTKTAEYIKQGQEAVPFLKKNFSTNKWEVLAGVSGAIKGRLLNNIESLSLKDQKFSKVAEEILEFLKILKVV